MIRNSAEGSAEGFQIMLEGSAYIEFNVKNSVVV